MAATINVDVANQAYPPPPPGPLQALPVAVPVAVAEEPALQPSFAIGTFSPQQPDVDVSFENDILQPVSDFIVTEGGTFQTNGTPTDIRTYTVLTTVTLGNGNFQVFFSGTPALNNLGLDLTGLNAYFPNQAPMLAPEQVPARAILFWSQDYIIVSPDDTNGNAMGAPMVGNTVRVAVIRQGPSTVADFGHEITVLVSGTPVNAVTTPQGGTRFLGDFRASDGVLFPFIGEGQHGPPFVGNFFPANQTYGTGLPANSYP